MGRGKGFEDERKLADPSAYSYDTYRATRCEDPGTYATNSTFSANLEQALDYLRNNTAATGFNYTTVGSSTQQVTALGLCRGTLDQSDCQACIDAATSDVHQACPNKKQAQIWYDLCVLRYSNVSFINQTDSEYAYSLFNTGTIPDPDDYNQRAMLLMQNLSYTAGVSVKRYAVGQTRLASNRPLYGYVDCTRDISGQNCTNCLQETTDSVSSCCVSKWTVWLMTPSCMIQYSLDTDHSDWVNGPLIDTGSSTAPSPAPGPADAELPPPSTFPSIKPNDDGRGNRIVIAISAVIILTGCLLVGALFISFKVKRRRNMEGRACGATGETAESIEDIDCIGMRSFLYEMDVLIAATDNFSLANRLGGGGFGTVYKGKLPNGDEIAIKKLTSSSSQGVEEFSNEVRLLLRMRHRDLVQLYDKSKSALLDWPKRCNIILGVARGLLYLHEDSQLKIVHRDIKASNILLDDQMNPKIADFGLARLFQGEQSFIKTHRIAGTFGYMAPEYATRGFVSTKCDVFSFGVLLLEIISGRKNYDRLLDEDKRELLDFTWRLEQQGRLIELPDATIGSFPQDDVLRCIRVGLLCSQKSMRDRPEMYSVLMMLSNNSMTIATAGRPGYLGHSEETAQPQPQPLPQPTGNNDDSSPNDWSFSDNSITITLPSGRRKMLIQLFFILFIFLPSTYAYEGPRGSVCDDSDIYTSNSTFSTNLDQALDNLRNTTATTGFNYTTVGNSTQQITGLALCRATINQSDCQACIDAATSGIQQACPGKKKAQVWYTLCMLRYSDVNFIHQPEDEVVSIIYNINDAPDPNDYNQRVALLMQNLSYSAGVSDKRYAVGQTRLASNQPLYGYVDCTRDISGQNCTNCLLDTVDAISSCCLDKWAVWLMTPTCNIQVSLDPAHSDWVNGPFIDTNSSIPLPPAPAPAPARAGMLPLPPPSTIPSTKHSPNEVGRGNRIVIILSAAAAATITVCLLVGVRFISVRARRRKNMQGRNSGAVGENAEDSADIEHVGMRSFMYEMDDLIAATDNFSLANWLGVGGFGTVYKGKMTNGDEIAVKKFTQSSMQGTEEFVNEVRFLLKMRHRNLVQLYGWCVHGEERMLIYEYLPNKSLDYFLFDKSKSALLDWPKRWKIIYGLARGLLYLHEDSQLKIIHRDIKASNVLLDDQMNPKISDFGLAKLFQDDQCCLRTRRIAGTFDDDEPPVCTFGFPFDPNATWISFVEDYLPY
ncbi:Gnk2-homologous domain [Dillenia turbinata]|uniref:non-specific serine/threonine protein kinase n=1 Tax=Dillenia turbinata TaxID=194707 RepID=A0AAN8Z6C6_9MAGN